MSSCNYKPNELYLTNKDVIDALAKSQIHLQRVNNLNNENYTINSVEPLIMSDKRVTEDLYFIYQYGSYEEMKIASNRVIALVGKFKIHLGEGINMPYVFKAKNIMVIYTPNPKYYYPKPNSYKKTLELIDSAFFNILNNGQTILYRGQSKNWTAYVKIRYYEHSFNELNGRTNIDGGLNIYGADNYYEITRILKYKGTYLPHQEFTYKYWGPNGKSSGEDIIIGYQEIYLPHLGFNKMDINNGQDIKFEINWCNSSELIKLNKIN